MERLPWYVSLDFPHPPLLILSCRCTNVTAIYCARSGQDNPSKLCVVGDVPNILKWNVGDHNGPYGGITMAC